jgi:hypothetical protein
LKLLLCSFCVLSFRYLEITGAMRLIGKQKYLRYSNPLFSPGITPMSSYPGGRLVLYIFRVWSFWCWNYYPLDRKNCPKCKYIYIGVCVCVCVCVCICVCVCVSVCLCIYIHLLLLRVATDMICDLISYTFLYNFHFPFSFSIWRWLW